jgi:hypothetical protein
MAKTSAATAKSQTRTAPSAAEVPEAALTLWDADKDKVGGVPYST